MDKKEIKDQLIEIHTQEAKRHVQKLKQSFRWKAGNAFARLIEMILFRKKEKLSIDFLEEHLQTIEQLSLQSTNKTKPNDLSISLQHHQKIGFLVSDTNIKDAVFGDTHVAHDFKVALEASYPTLSCHLINYKHLKEIDAYNILINMLWDATLPHHTKTDKSFKIAWIRNYPDRWLTNPSFLKYDLYLCSSKKIVDSIQQHTQKPVHLFPIAANINRFQPNEEIDSSNEICFVGNRWKEGRNIESFFENKQYPIKIYGKGWDAKKFDDKVEGPIANQAVPKLYQKAKFILDCANQTTSEWASLNSRVFNAIATKKMVFTNSIEAVNLFKYPISTYQNEEELINQLQHFDGNETAYVKAKNHLYEELINNHTYTKRAKMLQLILAPKLRISIKISAKQEQQKHFGDWYFAKSLSKAMQYFGHKVQVDNYDNWFNVESPQMDLVINLRGLRAYQPILDQTSFMWLISHPDEVSIQEIQQYQHCFIASNHHYQKLEKLSVKNISLLPQCTDTSIFKKIASAKKDKLLFVGNSRNVFRKSVKFALNAGYKIDVIGKDWKQFIPVKYIQAEFIPNEKLYQLYNEYTIVLNDHWEDMLTQGYVSNRLFDASACGATILSDCPKGSKHLIPEIYYYKDQTSFKEQVETIQASKTQPLQHYYEVHNKHTFLKRAETILHQYYQMADEKMA